jgi:hypothetical protein
VTEPRTLDDRAIFEVVKGINFACAFVRSTRPEDSPERKAVEGLAALLLPVAPAEAERPRMPAAPAYTPAEPREAPHPDSHRAALACLEAGQVSSDDPAVNVHISEILASRRAAVRQLQPKVILSRRGASR